VDYFYVGQEKDMKAWVKAPAFSDSRDFQDPSQERWGPPCLLTVGSISSGRKPCSRLPHRPGLQLLD